MRTAWQAIVLGACGLGGGALSLSGGSIILGGGTIYLSDAVTLVPEGSRVSVGYFYPDFTDFAGLNGRAWDDIQETDYVEILDTRTGPLGDLSASTRIQDSEGLQLYLWVFAELSDPGWVGEREFGLFTGGQSWVAKGDRILPFDQNRLLVSEVTAAHYGAVVESGLALQPVPVGAVPEPEHMGLVMGAGLLAVVLWRRRGSLRKVCREAPAGVPGGGSAARR